MASDPGIVKSAAPATACDLFEVVSAPHSFDNRAATWCSVATAGTSGGNAMDALLGVISIQTFWKILLFVHFALAVVLLAGVSLQSVAVLMPARRTVGNVVDRAPVPAAAYTTLIVILYVLQALMGAWIYVKYRTYVRIPMEGFRHWWTVGSFEFKEHVVTMGLALLPAYWYFWREPQSDQHATIRKLVTIFLAFTVWYSFVVGHVANDFRGVGS
jgi:hypothetical protein